MKLSIVTEAQLAQWFVDIGTANDPAALHAAFARLAIICDGVACRGWMGRFKLKPSDMSTLEFLNYFNDNLEKLMVAGGSGAKELTGISESFGKLRK